jgi:hypothetical protein
LNLLFKICVKTCNLFWTYVAILYSTSSKGENQFEGEKTCLIYSVLASILERGKEIKCMTGPSKLFWTDTEIFLEAGY